MFDLPPWDSLFYAVASFLFGICVGSFLNVVIYRVPRGLSVNEPKRSFCPTCQKEIPISRNIPLFTWLSQLGKCYECKSSIPSRYFWVELLTGLLWVACWYYFSSPLEAVFFMILSAMALVIIAVDMELMLIPRQYTLFTGAVALIGGALMPERLGQDSWSYGLLYAAFGMAIGWTVLWLVVLLGKAMFGKREFKLDEEAQWSLRESETDDVEMCFVIDDEAISWSDIFFRDHYIMIDDEKIDIEELKSLDGKTTSATIPREAMGMGDVDLLAVLGGVFGAPALLLIVLFACVFTIAIAMLGRLGLGKQIPFGPSLIAGGAFWLIYGQDAWNWYMGLFT